MCASTGSILRRVQLHAKPVRDVCASPASAMECVVASASLDCKLVLSNPSTGALLCCFDMAAPAWSCCWHPTSQFQVLCGLQVSTLHIHARTLQTNGLFGCLQTGKVVLVDIRMPGMMLMSWGSSSNSQSPLHALASCQLGSGDVVLAGSVTDVQVISNEDLMLFRDELPDRDGFVTHAKTSVSLSSILPAATATLSQEGVSPSRTLPYFPGPLCSIASDNSSGAFMLSFRSQANGGQGKHWVYQASTARAAHADTLIDAAAVIDTTDDDVITDESILPLVEPVQSAGATVGTKPPIVITGHHSSFVLSRAALFSCGSSAGKLYCASGDELSKSVFIWSCADSGAVLQHRTPAHTDAILDVKVLTRASTADVVLATLSASTLMLHKCKHVPA